MGLVGAGGAELASDEVMGTQERLERKALLPPGRRKALGDE
eukprot:SAG11_NODE_26890_length_339_cov_1.287500_1_plen_40_part_01